jgi:hypothetical protein
MRRRFRRRVLTAVLLALALGACTGSADDDRAEPTPSSSTTTTAPLLDPLPSVTHPEPVGPVAAPDPPELENSGDEYGRVYKSLHIYISWLGHHPDRASDLLANAVVPDSQRHATLTDTFRRALEAGLHYSDQPESLIGYEFVRTIDPSNVEIKVVLSTNLERTSRADGSVYATSPGYRSSTRQVVLHRDDSSKPGPWRISVDIETERIPWPPAS